MSRRRLKTEVADGLENTVFAEFVSGPAPLVDLVDVVYGHRSDGGPENAEQRVVNAITKLKTLGVDVVRDLILILPKRRTSYELSPTQRVVFDALRSARRGGILGTELQRQLELSKTTMLGAIHKMRERGVTVDIELVYRIEWSTIETDVVSSPLSRQVAA